MISDIVRIPKERKPVLIGKDGSFKRFLEKKTKTTIKIDVDVEISGEPLDVMKVVNIVKAIGRGFSSDDAKLLLNEDYVLEVISLYGETSKTIKRLMGRVIGRKGYTKEKIEKKTNTMISVFGKTVSIIGKGDGLIKAYNSLNALLSGRQHAYAYKKLD